MEELMNQITPYIMIILTAIAGYLATKIKSYFDAKIDKDNQERLMQFIKATVEFVEQIGIDLKPEEKFELAKAKVLIWINQKGITVTEEELQVLIEAFVHNLTLSKPLGIAAITDIDPGFGIPLEIKKEENSWK